MHTIHYHGGYPESVDWRYGLGWMFFNDSGVGYQGHHGDTFGSHCRMKYRESDKTGVIFFHNYSPPMKNIEKNIQLMEIYPVIFDVLFNKADEFV